MLFKERSTYLTMYGCPAICLYANEQEAKFRSYIPEYSEEMKQEYKKETERVLRDANKKFIKPISFNFGSIIHTNQEGLSLHTKFPDTAKDTKKSPKVRSIKLASEDDHAITFFFDTWYFQEDGQHSFSKFNEDKVKLSIPRVPRKLKEKGAIVFEKAENLPFETAMTLEEASDLLVRKINFLLTDFAGFRFKKQAANVGVGFFDFQERD